MGNIIAASASIGVPLMTKTVVTPYIFHPLRWGGIPWSQPHWIIMALVTFIVNVILLMFIGTVSGMMSTKKLCNKINLVRSIKRSLWIVMGYVVGNIMLAILPFVKAPILALTLWMPYAGWIVHGLCVAIFVLFFGAIGNSMLRNEVCRGLY